MAMESERPREVVDACVVQVLGPEHQAELARLTQCLGLSFCASNTLATANWSAGAFVNQRLCGLVEGRDSGNPNFVEVSLVVEPAWRRRGLGAALLEAAICWGKASGRSTLRMIFSRHDWSMRKLASKANAQFDMVLDRMWADVTLYTPSCPNLNQTGEHNG
jgi:GNAT superfamily N-acetyltransferase